jgi:hypothetical protein
VLTKVWKLLSGGTVRERREQFAKSLDGQQPTPEQMKLLGQMIQNAFLMIRSDASDSNLVFALSDAFHNLPRDMFEPNFSWYWLAGSLHGLEQKHPVVGQTFLTMLDRAMGFK